MMILTPETITDEYKMELEAEMQSKVQSQETEVETEEEGREYQKKRLYQVRLKSKGHESQSEKA
jgi:hypothetical protein